MEPNQPSRLIKSKPIVSCLACFCLALNLDSRAQTKQSTPAPVGSSRRKIQVGDPVLAGRLAAQGARLIADYGGFQLLEADETTVAALGGKGQWRDGYNTILLNAARLDTSRSEMQSQRQAVGEFPGKRLHLVHFAGPAQPEWRDSLQQAGAQIIAYIPENAYLVYGDAPAIAGLQNWAANSPRVQWEGAYRDEYKIHPRAKQVDAQGNPRQIGTDIFAIQLVADDAANAETLNLLDTLKLEPFRRQNHVLNYRNVLGRFTAGDLARIAARPDVISIIPWFVPHKMDERQDQLVAGNQTGGLPNGPGYLKWLESKGFTQAQFDASDFAVDISDSGIDNGTNSPNHFGLYAGGVIGSGNSRVIYNRLEGTSNANSTIKGCDGHGTINAHIVGGFDDSTGFPFQDSVGYHYGLGVCPYVRLGSSVIFDPDKFTYPNYSILEAAAYTNGARISNDSWGGSAGVYDSDCQEFDTFVRNAYTNAPGNHQMIMVFAAGNDPNGPAPSTVTEPGTAKNVISVGATEGVQSLGGTDNCGTPDAEAENGDRIASFSGRGPCDDGRHKPDLVAPGTHISGGVAQAANPGADGTADPCFLADGSGVCGGVAPSLFFPSGQEFYTTSTGTSHSTPAVTGASALLRQYFINNGWTPPSPALNKAWLMNSARYLTGSGADDALWSDSQGMGDLDLGTALDGTRRVFRDQLAADMFTATGQSRTLKGAVVDTSKPFRVTLAWTDAPGSTTGTATANDLDLTVTIGGVTYLGNVFNGPYSTSGGSADMLDNVESVFLPAGTSGNYIVTVSAANINSVGVPNTANALNQDFALLVYNAIPIQVSSATLAEESCFPTNGVIDPGETVKVNFDLANGGNASVSNVVVTLLATGGVDLPDAPKSIPVLTAGGPAATVPFTFTAEGTCGGVLTASLELTSGTNNLGTVAYFFTLGQLVNSTAFAQNFDSVTPPALPSGWTTDVSGGQQPWITTNRTADTPPNAAFCADTPNLGVSELLSPVIAVSGSASQLVFRQSYDLEADQSSGVGYDGGVLEIAIGTNAFQDILAAGGTFVSGGYDVTISPYDDPPLAGRQAWSGLSGPYATNSYIATIVQLPASALGQNVRFKWRCGTDLGNQSGHAGWRVDTIVMIDSSYACCTGEPVEKPQILSPSSPLQTTNPSVQISGTSTPGLMLVLYDNEASNATLSVTAEGTFSADVLLDYGTNVLTTVESDVATNLTSALVTVIVTPEAPTLSAPAKSAPAVAVSGKGVPQAVVKIYSGDPTSGTLIAAVTNNAEGAFSGTITLPAGAYSLAATETINGVTSTASAAVPVAVTLLPPQFVEEPQSQAMFAQGTVVFTATATGAAPLKYAWQHNNTPIPGAASATLTLKNITAASAGSYVLVAKNAYGSASSDPAVLTLIANPFPKLAGNYYGLFAETNPRFQSSGLLRLSLSRSGAYSGRILNAGGSYGFTGSFTPAGQSAQSVSRGTGKTPFVLDLILDSSTGAPQILGTVSNEAWVAPLQAGLTAPFTNAGKFTLVFNNANTGAGPGGSGFGKVTVTLGGMASLTGTLADNTTVAPAAAGVSSNGQWPLYIPLYNGGGSLAGWVTFTNGSDLSLEGAAAWFRPAHAGKFYPGGFTNTVSILGSTFAPPAARTPALALTNLEITLRQGGLPEALSNEVTLTLGGKFAVDGPGIPKLTLSLAPSTGVISGAFSNSATGMSSPIKGVILQRQNTGAGFFEDANSTGSFSLAPP